MVDVKNKLCPFRVFREKTTFRHSGAEATTEKFYDCIGEKCAAYFQGGCLRLMPYATALNCAPLTDEEIEEYLREVSMAPIFSKPTEPPEPYPSCPTCANNETKAGCADCVLNADNRKRKETLAQNWMPKEVPW